MSRFDELPIVDVFPSVQIGFCNISVPGNATILIYFISCLFDSSRGRKPKAFVHVSLTSATAGMTSFSTLREERACNKFRRFRSKRYKIKEAK